MQKKYILLDISGACNAKCPYCVTGAKNHETGGFMEITMFKSILAKLARDFKAGTVALYNWGEPLLHPGFQQITEEFSNYNNFNYELSTNSSIPVNFTRKMVTNCSRLRLSISGFSQQSYDRIYQLPFEKVKANIRSMTAAFRKYNPETLITLAYLTYKFNTKELPLAKNFAADLGIDFQAEYAFINDLNKGYAYRTGILDAGERAKIDSELFMEKLTLDQQQATDTCPTKKFLTINHRGEVMVSCCAPYDEEEFIIGNYLEMSAEEVLKTETNYVPFCKKCLASKFPFYIAPLATDLPNK